MEKRDYLTTASSSINLIKKNLLIYIPDISLLLITFILSAIFLYINNLTHIFTGELDIFAQTLKSILNNGSLLLRFVISLLVIGIFNLVVGIGTITWRFTMIKQLTQTGKINLKKSWNDTSDYIWAVLGLKASLLVLYLIPAILIFGIAVVFRPSLFILGILLAIVFIVFRILFLFSYAIIFLDNIKNPFSVLQGAYHYFKSHKSHTIVTGLFVLLITAVIGFLINILILIWGSFSGYFSLLTNISILSLLFVFIKNLIDITLNIWGALFIFKNY